MPRILFMLSADSLTAAERHAMLEAMSAVGDETLAFDCVPGLLRTRPPATPRSSPSLAR
jgi:hypothetical protein